MKNYWTILILVFSTCVLCSSRRALTQDLQSAAETSVKESKSIDELKSKLIKDLAFHFAATNQVDLLKKLTVELKSEKDPRDSSGSSMVHYAVRGGAEETLEWLMASGHDIEATNTTGDSPMCVAAQSGNDEMVDALFKAGANVNGTLPQRSPVMIAAKSGHDSTLKMLLGFGADSDATDKNGDTVLHHATRSGSITNVQLLLNHGADASLANKEKQTPLSIALKQYAEIKTEDVQYRDWGTEQVFGPPDATFGDCRQGWASKSQDGQPEWLIVEFDTPVIPRSMEIHENYSPNAVNKITWFDSEGKEQEAWSGADPAAPNDKGIYVANISIDIPEKARRFKIYIDSVNVAGWNEIDAVGLVSDKGKQWVSWAEASSCYASGDFLGGRHRTILNMLKYHANKSDTEETESEK